MQFDKLTDPIDYTEENFIGAKVLLITSMSFLGISYGLIFLLWFFMVFDTLLGLIASIVINGWDSITKTRFWAGILTKISILFIPLSLAITGALAGFNLNIFVFSSIYVLIANDAISCFTNLLSIKTKKRYINRDLVEILINALRSSIYKFAEGIITKIKKD
jgi:phage-related holin